MALGTVLTYCGVIPDEGVLGFDESIDSCITATLNLFLYNTTPSSVSLLPIPLALNCRTLNVLSSLICSADGAGFRDVRVVVGLVAGSLRPSRDCMPNLYFSDTVLRIYVARHQKEQELCTVWSSTQFLCG